MSKQGFKELVVWQKAKVFAVAIYKLTSDFRCFLEDRTMIQARPTVLLLILAASSAAAMAGSAQFKTLIEKAPPLEMFCEIIRFDLDPPQPKFYWVRWRSPDAYVIRSSIDLAGITRPITTNTFGEIYSRIGSSYAYSSGNWGQTMTAEWTDVGNPIDQGNTVQRSVEFSYERLWPVLNMGLDLVKPATLRWQGDSVEYEYPERNLRISGKLTTNIAGRVESFIVKKQVVGETRVVTMKIDYEYPKGDLPDTLPDQFTVSAKPSDQDPFRAIQRCTFHKLILATEPITDEQLRIGSFMTGPPNVSFVISNKVEYVREQGKLAPAPTPNDLLPRQTRER